MHSDVYPPSYRIGPLPSECPALHLFIPPSLLPDPANPFLATVVPVQNANDCSPTVCSLFEMALFTYQYVFKVIPCLFVASQLISFCHLIFHCMA